MIIHPLPSVSLDRLQILTVGRKKNSHKSKKIMTLSLIFIIKHMFLFWLKSNKFLQKRENSYEPLEDSLFLSFRLAMLVSLPLQISTGSTIKISLPQQGANPQPSASRVNEP